MRGFACACVCVVRLSFSFLSFFFLLSFFYNIPFWKFSPNSTSLSTIAHYICSVVKYILKDNFDNWTKDGDDNILFGLLRRWLGSGIFTVQHG